MSARGLIAAAASEVAAYRSRTLMSVASIVVGIASIAACGASILIASGFYQFKRMGGQKKYLADLPGLVTTSTCSL